MSDLISRQAAIKRLREYANDDMTSMEKAIGADYCVDLIRIMPSAQADRSLWFRIGEICVDESKGFISAGRAVEKIRELLREAERREE